MMNREQEIIRIVKALVTHHPNVEIGIGDDAAVVKSSHTKQVISTDSYIENVHFKTMDTNPFYIGYKAVTACASDLPAMGARPSYLILALGLPVHVDLSWVRHLAHGIYTACIEYSLTVIGGDTTQSPGPIFLNVTCIGEPYCKDGLVIKQNTVAPKQALFISKTVGDSLAGLLLKYDTRFSHLRTQGFAQKLMDAHHAPRLDLKWSEWAAQTHLVAAMTDTSDGLFQDLQKMLRHSPYGAHLFMESLPLSDVLVEFAKAAECPAWDLALYGAEDYALLYTIKEEHQELWHKQHQKVHGYAPYKIGEITTSPLQLSYHRKSYTPQFKYQFSH